MTQLFLFISAPTNDVSLKTGLALIEQLKFKQGFKRNKQLVSIVEERASSIDVDFKSNYDVRAGHPDMARPLNLSPSLK